MSDRTFAPTPTRKAEARREGRFPRSADLSALAVLLGGLGLLGHFGSVAVEGMIEMVQLQLGDLAIHLQQLEPALEQTAGKVMVVWWLPFALALVVVGLASQLLQGGWIWAPQRILPRVTRLRAGSYRPSFAACLALVGKLGTILVVTGFLVQSRLMAAFADSSMARLWTGAGVSEQLLRAGMSLAAATLAVAALDYAWALWRYHHSLMMTAEEMREEMRGRTGGLGVRPAPSATRERQPTLRRPS